MSITFPVHSEQPTLERGRERGELGDGEKPLVVLHEVPDERVVAPHGQASFIASSEVAREELR